MTDRKTRSKARLSRSKFAAYSVAGVAAMTCAPADAAITYTTVNQTLSDSNADPDFIDGSAVLQLLFGANNSYQLGMWHNLAAGANGSAVAGGQLLGNVPTGASIAGFQAVLNNITYNYVVNVPYGQQISAQPFLAGNAAYPLMAYRTGYPNSQFLTQGEGFVGVRFNTNQYGWVRVQMDGNPLNSFTVVDYAFASPGESLFAGQTTAVPEPGSLASLALGAVGLARWRRRNRAA